MLNSASKDILIKYINSFSQVAKSQPFGKHIDVYCVNEQMFALIKNSEPVIISLRCDNALSKILQDKYESAMPGQKLDQEKWISIIDSGQVPPDELKSLIILSYNLAKEALN